MEYRVDARDLRFQLLEWLPIGELLAEDRFGDWDPEGLGMVIEEARRIAQEQMAPGNEEGDREGARLEDGRVSVPSSYRQAYATVAEGGWIGCVDNPDYGGMGLPHVAGTVINELFAGANLSLSLVFLLTRGTGALIENHGTEEMRELFCENLYSGRWTGTMCLTEPQAGSDVGASTARAERLANGRYRISGEKIFITYGDHDLTENIVHAVLARLPDAPAGSKGLSLFVVPKLRVGADGTPGEPNDVVCASIEHKMGIHGSPTCSLLFGPEGSCEGWILGEEHSGLRLMFEMMNSARIEVGLQGAAVAAAAHQAALAYARERVQGRHWSRLSDRTAEPVAIVEHPDVRRLLLTSAGYVQAMRALLLETALCLDLAESGEGEEAELRRAWVELLTPVCKAWASDWGFRVTEWCLQVYGGYGYTRDYPAEQYLRDAKIASIYEGTNGIQALDLLLRKIPAEGGRPFRKLLERAGRTASRLASHHRLADPAEELATALSEVRETLYGLATDADGTRLALLNAVPVLDMVGTTLGAWLLLDQGALASSRLDAILEARGIERDDREACAALLESDREAVFYHNKTLTAAHFGLRALPHVRAFAAAVRRRETTPYEIVL